MAGGRGPGTIPGLRGAPGVRRLPRRRDDRAVQTGGHYPRSPHTRTGRFRDLPQRQVQSGPQERPRDRRHRRRLRGDQPARPEVGGGRLPGKAD